MSTKNTHLHYEIAGEGDTIILGHAGFVDSRMWDDQWRAFSDQYRVVRFDMQGYGASGIATAPISRSKELLGLMQGLEIDKAHLVGCSLSGTAYLDFTLKHPQKVLSLTLVNATPGGFEMQGEPPRYMLEMIDAINQGDFEKASELQIRIWIDGNNREPDEIDPEIRQKASEMNIIPIKNGTLLIANQPVEPLDPPAITRLAEIQCPVLVIDSTEDNPEIHRAADLMANKIPNARYATIEGAAHLPNMEKPEIFNQLVLDFLD